MKQLLLNISITLLFVSVILSSFFVYPKPNYNDVHTCRYKLCPYKGLNKFIPQFPEHPASCTLDSLHFINPYLDYDQEIEILGQNNITLSY